MDHNEVVHVLVAARASVVMDTFGPDHLRAKSAFVELWLLMPFRLLPPSSEARSISMLKQKDGHSIPFWVMPFLMELVDFTGHAPLPRPFRFRLADVAVVGIRYGKNHSSGDVTLHIEEESHRSAAQHPSCLGLLVCVRNCSAKRGSHPQPSPFHDPEKQPSFTLLGHRCGLHFTPRRAKRSVDSTMVDDHVRFGGGGGAN